MSSSAQVWLLLFVAFVAANLPFVSERVLLVGPLGRPKHFAWRLLELLLLTGVVIALGSFIEARAGQRAPQAWAFYAVVVCLMLTASFPGFVWRHLRRGAGRERSAVDDTP